MTQSNDVKRPNILFIMCDQYRFPRFSYGEKGGFAEPLKQILGFQEIGHDPRDFPQYFPGFMRLREHAVVLRNHTIAASACVPSRATIFTGQYGTRTGVRQTDGMFKSGDASNFPWLQPEGIPTIGDWFRAAGYETHYFGKCHFANPPEHSLERFGFDDWEFSYPEPHGTAVNNLGFFRDHGFADLVTTFLRRKGLALGFDRKQAEFKIDDPRVAGAIASDQNAPSSPPPEKPWFAVASFTNPHDIAGYPVQQEQLAGKDNLTPGPLKVPNDQASSIPPSPGTWQMKLNPDGFPRENALPPPTQNEDLLTKPDCQFDSSLKIGLALISKVDSVGLLKSPELSGLPFPLTPEPDKWCHEFLQYYAYLHQEVDQHIHAVLAALDETGLADNTIVVFNPDHGEYGAAHGMQIEKWHAAYQEAIHVPMVVSSRLVNVDPAKIRQVDALTSNIDILPTLLGLAGIGPAERRVLAAKLRVDHLVPELVGADLAPLVQGKTDQVIETDRQPREGVLFITDDMITQTLPYIDDPHSKAGEGHFAQFVHGVEEYRTHKVTPPPGVDDVVRWQATAGRMQPGPVCQPCHVRCVRTPRHKLVRYFDPAPQNPKPDQWEMYDLEQDPNEAINLLVYDGPFPTPIVPGDMDIIETAQELRKLLARLEARMLEPGDYPPPDAE